MKFLISIKNVYIFRWNNSTIDGVIEKGVNVGMERESWQGFWRIEAGISIRNNCELSRLQWAILSKHRRVPGCNWRGIEYWHRSAKTTNMRRLGLPVGCSSLLKHDIPPRNKKPLRWCIVVQKKKLPKLHLMVQNDILFIRGNEADGWPVIIPSRTGPHLVSTGNSRNIWSMVIRENIKHTTFVEFMWIFQHAYNYRGYNTDVRYVSVEQTGKF